MNFMAVSSSSFGVVTPHQPYEGRNIISKNCHQGPEAGPKLLARAFLGGFPVGRWGAKNPHDSLFVA
jgi:hypothetical protein